MSPHAPKSIHDTVATQKDKNSTEEATKKNFALRSSVSDPIARTNASANPFTAIRNMKVAIHAEHRHCFGV